MAIIEEFTIHGLAGRSDVVHRELDRHINVFWGLNGAGKTSLLKILNSALRYDPLLVERVPFVSAEVVFWSTDHEARIRRTLTRTPVDAEDSDESDESPSLEPVGDGMWREVTRSPVVQWRTEVLESVTPPKLDGAFRHTYLPISRLTQRRGARTYLSQSGARAADIDDAYLDKEFADQVRLKWQNYNADALLRIRAIQQQGLASILATLFGGAIGPQRALPEDVEAAEAFRLVTDFLKEQGIYLKIGQKQFTATYDSESNLRGVVATIQEVAEEVEEATRPQLQFQQVIENLYSGGKQLVFDYARTARGSLHVEWNGSRIPLQSLSSGEKQLLRLMLEVLAADDTTVMIDEPELSMHVDWQQVLVESMSLLNPNCQLLLATHSPEVMADVPDKYVFEL